MREIKFRAWDTKVMKMMSWQILLDSLDLNNLLSDEQPQVSGYYQLMQYTGLKDKNGVEIYEGDVIRTEFPDTFPTTGEVQFIEGGFFRTVKPGQFCSYPKICASHIYGDYTEVIGNIYENPELLEKK